MENNEDMIHLLQEEGPGPEGSGQPQPSKPKKSGMHFGWLLVAVLLVVGYFFMSSQVGEDEAISDLKSIVFDQYTNLTLGQTVSQTVSGAKWSAEKQEEGQYHVTVSGFVKELGSNIKATFAVSYVDDSVYGRLSRVEADGQVMDDLLTLNIVMAALCGA